MSSTLKNNQYQKFTDLRHHIVKLWFFHKKTMENPYFDGQDLV